MSFLVIAVALIIGCKGLSASVKWAGAVIFLLLDLMTIVLTTIVIRMID